jgi:hypothetical protein
VFWISDFILIFDSKSCHNFNHIFCLKFPQYLRTLVADGLHRFIKAGRYLFGRITLRGKVKYLVFTVS